MEDKIKTPEYEEIEVLWQHEKIEVCARRLVCIEILGYGIGAPMGNINKVRLNMRRLTEGIVPLAEIFHKHTTLPVIVTMMQMRHVGEMIYGGPRG